MSIGDDIMTQRQVQALEDIAKSVKAILELLEKQGAPPQIPSGSAFKA